MYTRVKTDAEIAFMRESGRQTALILQALVDQIDVGMTTKDVADIVRAELKAIPDHGKHAFFGYEGFPEVICISVNDEVVHGIPSQHRVLEEGDVVGLDYGVNYRGMITDADAGGFFDVVCLLNQERRTIEFCRDGGKGIARLNEIVNLAFHGAW